MYNRHFGLSRQPFSIAPNPRFLYMSPQHREALAHLVYGVRNRDGFVQLTGEVGTGKTTICRCLVERLPQGVEVALILNPRISALELVASLCDELKIPYPKDTTSIKVLTDALNTYLLANHAAGRRTVLIIDEAQCLSAETLEQVRLLTNLETSNAKLLQIILVGQPELRELLARDDLRQLAQRITARFHLQPISRAETAAYIRHRLRLAGSDKAVFDERAIDLIHRLAKGVPRLINVLCDRAMLGAFAEGRHAIDPRIVRRAATEVLPMAGQDQARRSPRYLGKALTLLLGLGLVLGLGYYLSPPGGSPISGLTPVPLAEPVLPPSPPGRTGEAPALPPSPPASASIPSGPPAAAPAASETAESVDVMPEATPEPAMPAEPIPEPSLAEHLDTAGSTAAARAWAGLYRLWGYDSAAATDEQACAQAPGGGLSCLQGAGSWGLLRRFDRPAVLLLQADDGRTVAVVLLRIDGDRVAVEVDGEALWIPAGEIESRWYGAYRLLWKTPPSGNLVLRPGMRGAGVRWLRERVAKANYPADAATADPALYDESLKVAVEALQRAHGLVADGIAGAHTFIVLNNLVADPEIPYLVGAATAASE
ncbi:MAG: AAA family ATPase [Chromatiaceae bacterium]|nr:AAA family ATPase [Chromatiaceae bacterium]MCP5314020.1 AAA family ATPase [Chromatiaceae bacterium]